MLQELKGLYEAECQGTECRLPEPARQYEVWDGYALLARIDFAYPDRRLAHRTSRAKVHEPSRVTEITPVPSG